MKYETHRFLPVSAIFVLFVVGAFVGFLASAQWQTATDCITHITNLWQNVHWVSLFVSLFFLPRLFDCIPTANQLRDRRHAHIGLKQLLRENWTIRWVSDHHIHIYFFFFTSMSENCGSHQEIRTGKAKFQFSPIIFRAIEIVNIILFAENSGKIIEITYHSLCLSIWIVSAVKIWYSIEFLSLHSILWSR